MPGSLLLSNDAYSDLSETSGRSLDSKIGAKKVSFNKAVRVKQYPWKPDLELNTSEHLTLPSNRFWFKVYKNKHETPDFNNTAELAFKTNAWGEENMECTHDSLAPIAEVEDQDLDSSNLQSGLSVTLNNASKDYHDRNGGKKDLYSINNYDSFNYRPTEPPVDYFDEMQSGSNNHYGCAKAVWGAAETNKNSYNNNHVLNSNLLNRSTYGSNHKILEESEENIEDDTFNDTTESVPKSMRLPRMSTRNDSPLRRSMRRLDSSDALKTRERRSRSHDDHLDNENRLKQLRKADKSVSTEDLNLYHGSSCFTNRFLRSSRDMATQCYGTLNRDKSATTIKSPSTSSHTQQSEVERLNNFKSPTSSRKSFNGNGLTTFGTVSYAKTGLPKKESQDDEFSKCIRPYYDNQTKNNLLSSERNLNYKKHDNHINGKLSNGIGKIISRGENTIPDRIQNQNGYAYKTQFPKTDFQPKSSLQYESRKQNNQTKMTRDSATVGYLRGRQIPLSEMNTNTNRKFLNKNETVTNRSLFHKASENGKTSFSPSRSVKSEIQTSNELRSKKHISSNLENSNGRIYKNGSHSAKTYTSVNSDGDNSMIDWSLSGFQLAPKPDNGISSISDSEYTVHRRPPLLMYIPGVSHHDRPALEDDRLSALSDLSRSELNDGLSSLAGSTTKDKNSPSDIRRRYSMPRDGKLKWIKWKNKG